MYRKRAAFLVTAVMASLMATVAAPTPALAAQTCYPILVFGSQTVEILGEPVAHTPYGGFWICLETPANVPTAPTLEVTTKPARLVQLVHPDGGGEQVSVRVSYAFGLWGGPSSGEARTVTLPIPMDGGKTCLFFQGNTEHNPGGCVAALAGEIPAVNDLFDALPLP